jgi:hypothetical protein
VANLHSVLILGPDAAAAASPATVVQLVHACHRWGFTTVVPSSWGDELLAGEVIRRCASRENRPAIQCSCPRVAERLGANAEKLDDSIFWLTTPPVAAANYIRAHSAGLEVHITYAGSCPGATDSAIDQRMSPTELLLAISSRGIDISAQPTVFENIIPPDRRRHFSASGGIPDYQRLWESAAFRVAQPSDIDLSIGVAQLLLAEERVLVDLAPLVGCVCRTESVAPDPTIILRSSTPVVREGVVDVSRAAPAVQERRPESLRSLSESRPAEIADSAPGVSSPARRNSPPRPLLRRQSAWRRPSPRTGVAVTRASAVVSVSDRVAFLGRSEVRVAVATAVIVASLMLGIWIGRRNSLDEPVQSTPPARARTP